MLPLQIEVRKSKILAVCVKIQTFHAFVSCWVESQSDLSTSHVACGAYRQLSREQVGRL